MFSPSPGARALGLRFALAFLVFSGCQCRDPAALPDPGGGGGGGEVATPGLPLPEPEQVVTTTPDAALTTGPTDAGEDCVDEDGDGLGHGAGCQASMLDCDDLDPTVGGFASEPCYSGPEGTEGEGACRTGFLLCEDGLWETACQGEVKPSAEKCDAVDNDCDGTVDEQVVRSCFDGASGLPGVGLCAAGEQTCSGGEFGPCLGATLPAAERCDNQDNDCDGVTDETVEESCYSGPARTAGVGQCRSGVRTCEAEGGFGECSGEVLPGAEVCDGIDNDCDGQVDEGVTRACYGGPAQASGVGLCVAGVETCSSGAFGACEGFVSPAEETCDGLDNDCDGNTDENAARIQVEGDAGSGEPIFAPVDIILVVDNSGSMTDEILAVQANLNGNFAAILDQSGLDYRVILIAKHGRAALDQSICIKAPLSGNGTCATPAPCPVNGPRFFHYSVKVNSHDSFEVMLDTYAVADGCGLAPAGWSQWLRPGATRVFLEITDDGPLTSGGGPTPRLDADRFEAALFALPGAPFGSAAGRNYVFHTIGGLKENSPRLSPWPPSAPLVTALCTGNGGDVEQNGLEYQKLSVRSGGARYPICEYGSFDAVFSQMARGIVVDQKLECAFSLPQGPSAGGLAASGLELIPSNGGARVPISRVASESACSGNAFYVSAGEVHLCPDACALWQSDPTALVDVLFSCGP